jgi:hypothetical protein
MLRQDQAEMARNFEHSRNERLKGSVEFGQPTPFRQDLDEILKHPTTLSQLSSQGS